MQELSLELPIPLNNYLNLLKQRKSPYYDILKFILEDMKIKYINGETVYSINPRILQNEIEQRIKDEKITNINICRTVLAAIKGSQLKEEEDYFATTTSSGRRNYHIRINQKTFTALSNLL